jgi:hypothetical protein
VTFLDTGKGTVGQQIFNSTPLKQLLDPGSGMGKNQDMGSRILNTG